MGQEQFVGPEYHTDFDPEKFLRDLKSAGTVDEGPAEDAADPGDAAELGGEGERT